MSGCKKFPHKELHRTRQGAEKHQQWMARTLGEDIVSPWLSVYPCGDHWHVGRDWRRFNKKLKNALRVGTATSRRNSRVRKKR